MKTHYSCAELAALRLEGFPTAKKNWIALVEREGWESRPRIGKGGGKEYLPPDALLKKIRAQEKIFAPASAEQKVVQAITVALKRLHEDDEAAAEANRQRGEAQLKLLAGGLSDHEALTLKGHCEIAEGWQVWFKKAQPMRKSASWSPYANAYNVAEVPVSKAVREAFPSVSPRSVQRWVTEFERNNLAALIDHRNGSDKRNKTIFSAAPLLAAYAKKMLMDKPGIHTEQLYKLLGTASKDAVTGESLFPAPSYHQTWRFQTRWIEENHDLYMQATNPDAFKNSVMLAFGSYSADVTALNQRWEMDATPADWLLLDTDGKKRRYTVSVIVDVWSRRALPVQNVALARRHALQRRGVGAGRRQRRHVDRRFGHCPGRQRGKLRSAAGGLRPFHGRPRLGGLFQSVATVRGCRPVAAPELALNQLAGGGGAFVQVARQHLAGLRQPLGFGLDLGPRRLQAIFLHGIGQRGDLGAVDPGALRRLGNAQEILAVIDDDPAQVRRLEDFEHAAHVDAGQGRRHEPGAVQVDALFLQRPPAVVAGWPRQQQVEAAHVVDPRDLAGPRGRLGKRRLPGEPAVFVVFVAALQPGIDALLQCFAAARALGDGGEIDQLALLGQPLGERLSRLDRLALGHVVAGEIGQQFENRVVQRADEALDVRLFFGREGQRGLVLDAERGQHPLEMLALVVLSVVRHDLRRHAPQQQRLAQRQAVRRRLWRPAHQHQYAALVEAHGGDIEVLQEPWQRRFYVGFPKSSIYREQASLAEAQSTRDTGHG